MQDGWLYCIWRMVLIAIGGSTRTGKLFLPFANGVNICWNKTLQIHLRTRVTLTTLRTGLRLIYWFFESYSSFCMKSPEGGRKEWYQVNATPELSWASESGTVNIASCLNLLLDMSLQDRCLSVLLYALNVRLSSPNFNMNVNKRMRGCVNCMCVQRVAC